MTQFSRSPDKNTVASPTNLNGSTARDRSLNLKTLLQLVGKLVPSVSL